MHVITILPCSTNTTIVRLSKPDLELDPRPIYYDAFGYTFQCSRISPTELLLTRTHGTITNEDVPDGRVKDSSLFLVANDALNMNNKRSSRGWNVARKKRSSTEWNVACKKRYSRGWNVALMFRVYDPKLEVVPSFKSNTYTYMGAYQERAPYDTVVSFIHPTVKYVQDYAFNRCQNMTKCYMGNQVLRIGCFAFSECRALKTIRLSDKLRRIGHRAFFNCVSIDVISLPNTVESIGSGVFQGCKELSLLSLPKEINMERIGSGIFEGCDALLDAAGRWRIKFETVMTKNEIHRDQSKMLLLYIRHGILGNTPPLHRACLDTAVTTQMIEDIIAQDDTAAYTSSCKKNNMTPLHIISMNVNVPTMGTIMTCFHANPGAAIAEDRHLGMSPVEYLREYGEVEDHLTLILALCQFRESSQHSTLL